MKMDFILQIFGKITTGFLILMSNTIDAASPNLLSLLGYNVTELLIKPCTNFSTSNENKILLEKEKLCSTSETSPNNFRLEFNHKIEGSFIYRVVRDISERKLMQSQRINI